MRTGRGKLRRMCSICNLEFETWTSHNSICCSVDCANKHFSRLLKKRYREHPELHPMLGRKLTQKWKDRISSSGKGKSGAPKGSLGFKGPHSEETKQKLREKQMGCHHSEKTKKKMSDSRKGEKHWNWQDGKSFEVYPMEFSNNLKERVRERDNFECQKCFVQESNLPYNYKLDIHHIDDNKNNNSPENLVSLCRFCHMKLHRSKIKCAV